MNSDSVGASELENVIAVFGAVDLAVQNDETGETRARVSALIPAYDSQRAHWYAVMLQSAVDRGVDLPVSIGDSDESVAEALRALAKTVPDSNRLAARRLLGIYAATQAVPEMFAPRGTHGPLVTGALSALLREGLEVDETSRRAVEAAQRLHEFMAGEHPSSDEQSPEKRWAELIGELKEYVDVSGLERPSCTDRLVPRPGGQGFATALRSEFDVKDIEFDQAVKILAPENWPRCMNFWCHMDPYDEPPHRYYEEVSTNCERPERAFFTAHAVLDFTFGTHGKAQITTYDLAPVPQPPDGLLVDRGSLVVHRLSDRLHITTTKRLRFKRALSGEGLSLVACIFGWTEMGKDMMYNCARLPVGNLRRVPRLEGQGSRRSPPRRAAVDSHRGAWREGAVTTHIARQTAATLKDCIDDQVAYVQEWADKVDDDDYGYDEMADDIARAGVRMVIDSARIMDLAVRNVRLGAAGARARRAPRSAPAAEPYDQEARSSWTTTTTE